jgi:hypothetical protein
LSSITLSPFVECKMHICLYPLHSVIAHNKPMSH